MRAIALIWSLGLCRNDEVFNDRSSSLLQVIYRCIGTLRLWMPLNRVEVHDLFREVCRRLENTARDLFSKTNDSKIKGLAHHPLRRFRIFDSDMQFDYFYF
jgi:hypothetical protein